jgi:hypothetical protein
MKTLNSVRELGNTWATTPGHIYARSICPRPAAVAAAPCHLKYIAINSHVPAETLLTVGDFGEHLMPVTSPILTTFSALV